MEKEAFIGKIFLTFAAKGAKIFNHHLIPRSVYCRPSALLVLEDEWTENLLPRHTAPQFRRIEWHVGDESRIFLRVKPIVPTVHVTVYIKVCFVGDHNSLKNVRIPFQLRKKLRSEIGSRLKQMETALIKN